MLRKRTTRILSWCHAWLALVHCPVDCNQNSSSYWRAACCSGLNKPIELVKFIFNALFCFVLGVCAVRIYALGIHLSRTWPWNKTIGSVYNYRVVRQPENANNQQRAHPHHVHRRGTVEATSVYAMEMVFSVKEQVTMEYWGRCRNTFSSLAPIPDEMQTVSKSDSCQRASNLPIHKGCISIGPQIQVLGVVDDHLSPSYYPSFHASSSS